MAGRSAREVQGSHQDLLQDRVSRRRDHLVLTARWPTALTIAGSDSGGGAGIQADLKTFAAHRVFGMSVVCAVTAQNTVGVTRIDPIPVAGVVAQLEAVFADLPVDAVKIGMLGDAGVIHAVADFLEALPARPPVVLDPVMVATSGDLLLPPTAVHALTTRLVPLAALITPNLPEVAALGGADDMHAWASGAGVPVLITGGDADGAEVIDTLVRGTDVRRWVNPRIGGGPVHGTGCTLSSAIAANLAGGQALDDAIDHAITWVRARISEGARLGGGSAVLLH